MLCCATDGTYLYAGTNEGQIVKITIATGEEDSVPWQNFQDKGDVPIAMVADDNGYLFVGMDSGRCYKIYIPSGVVSSLPTIPGRILCITCNGAGTRVVAAMAGGTIYSTDLT